MMSDRPTRFPQIKKTTKPGEFLRMVIIPWLFCCQCDEWTMDAHDTFFVARKSVGGLLFYTDMHTRIQNSHLAFPSVLLMNIT
jgi:hypothetical protein